jgi:hypothetical protein
MLNKSDNVLLTIPTADAQVGVWAKDAAGKYVFTETTCSNNVNAIHVITRRTQAVNGPVPTLFARVLGREFTEVTANATALLGWVSKLRKGIGFPIAVDKKFVPAPGSMLPCTFSSTSKDNGCWHSFNIPNASASVIKKIIDGTNPAPGCAIGDPIDLNNGWDTTNVQEIKRIEQDHVRANDPWIVILPVIDVAALGGNYNQATPVIGFVAFRVDHVDASGNPKSISGYTLGGYVAPVADEISVTPGSNTSLRSSTPKMVY